jgi:hypothetical protein
LAKPRRTRHDGPSDGVLVAALIARDFEDDSAWLAVPVAGPWIGIANQTPDEPWFFVFDGLLQLGGAALVSGALLYPERTLGPASSDAPIGTRLTVAKQQLVLSGRF